LDFFVLNQIDTRRPEIQKSAGALIGQKASKAVSITTSTFTLEADDYASSVDCKVVLIDGEKLASLMIEHNLGISTVTTFEIKRIDSDYFESWSKLTAAHQSKAAHFSARQQFILLQAG